MYEIMALINLGMCLLMRWTISLTANPSRDRDFALIMLGFNVSLLISNLGNVLLSWVQ